MRLVDTYTGNEIATIITNHGLTMDEAISLSGMEKIVIGPSTEEIGDGDEHWYDSLELLNDEE